MSSPWGKLGVPGVMLDEPFFHHKVAKTLWQKKAMLRQQMKEVVGGSYGHSAVDQLYSILHEVFYLLDLKYPETGSQCGVCSSSGFTIRLGPYYGMNTRILDLRCASCGHPPLGSPLLKWAHEGEIPKTPHPSVNDVKMDGARSCEKCASMFCRTTVDQFGKHGLQCAGCGHESELSIDMDSSEAYGAAMRRIEELEAENALLKEKVGQQDELLKDLTIPSAT